MDIPFYSFVFLAITFSKYSFNFLLLLLLAGGKHCDPSEFMCVGTGICAQKIWRCDGDDDCGNGYDERDCRKYLILYFH